MLTPGDPVMVDQGTYWVHGFNFLRWVGECAHLGATDNAYVSFLFDAKRVALRDPNIPSIEFVSYPAFQIQSESDHQYGLGQEETE